MKLRESGVVIEDIQEYEYENKEESINHKKDMEKKGYKSFLWHFESRKIGKPVFSYIKDITEEYQALNRDLVNELKKQRDYLLSFECGCIGEETCENCKVIYELNTLLKGLELKGVK